MVKPSDSLGRRMARAREKLEWSQEELALKSGIPRRTIQNIEYDEVSPQLETLTQIAKALQITVSELIGEESSPFFKRRIAELIAAQETTNSGLLGARGLESENIHSVGRPDSKLAHPWENLTWRLLAEIANSYEAVEPRRQLGALYILSKNQVFLSALANLPAGAQFAQVLEKLLRAL